MYVLVVLGPRTLSMLNKYYTIDLYFQLLSYF